MNLYQQLSSIEVQCRQRCFSPHETGEMMRLCIYSCVRAFPARSQQLPFRDHVLASPRAWAESVQPLSTRVNTPSQSASGGDSA